MHSRGAGVKAGCGAAGAVLMSGGLGLMLANGHDPAFEPLVIAGSLFAVTGMALFFVLVVTERPRTAANLERTAPTNAWPA